MRFCTTPTIAPIATAIGNIAGSHPFTAGALGTAVAINAGYSCFPFAAPAPIAPEFDDTFEDDELVYTANASYAFTDDIRAYASFTHGFKSGGFNLDPTAAQGGADPRFRSELVDAYELGLKTELFDERLRANFAISKRCTRPETSGRRSQRRSSCARPAGDLR